MGQSAEVLLDSTFEAIPGSVQSVSGADTLSSGNLLVRTVTIAVRNTGNLTASQAATATINGVSALSSARFSYQREQSVTAQNSGTVSALCVKEGAQVSADTALIQLSGDKLTKQVLNASDNLRSAELSVEDTQKQDGQLHHHRSHPAARSFPRMSRWGIPWAPARQRPIPCASSTI